MPAGKTDAIFFDDTLPGFGLRLRAKAHKSVAQTWLFQYRSPTDGRSRRIVFGSPVTLRASKARSHAERLHAQVKLGRDPQAEKQESRSRAKDNFGSTVEQYLARRKAQVVAGQLAQSSYEQIEHSLTKHFAGLTPFAVRDITQQDVARALSKIEAGIAANRARSWLSHFFGWTMREGIVEANPVTNTNRPVENEAPRSRVLSDIELAAVWKACADDDYGRVVRLLILTGQRRDEVGSMTWTEVNLGSARWSLAAARTKNRRPHSVPLSPPVLEILRVVARGGRDHVFGIGNGGFQGWSRAKRALDKRIAEAWPADADALAHWTVHDLRRTAASGMAHLRINLPTIEKVLNHASGSFGGIVGVYQQHDFAEEKREALVRWAAHVVGLVEESKAKVIPLQRTA